MDGQDLQGEDGENELLQLVGRFEGAVIGFEKSCQLRLAALIQATLQQIRGISSPIPHTTTFFYECLVCLFRDDQCGLLLAALCLFDGREVGSSIITLLCVHIRGLGLLYRGIFLR